MKLYRVPLQQVFALICCIASTVHAYRLGGYSATKSGVDSVNGGHPGDRRSCSCIRLSLVKAAYAGFLDSTGGPTSNVLSITSKTIIEAEGSGNPCRIKVIGVGGGGGNAVNRMLDTPAGTAQWCVIVLGLRLTVACHNRRSLWLRVVDCQH